MINYTKENMCVYMEVIAVSWKEIWKQKKRNIFKNWKEKRERDSQEEEEEEEEEEETFPRNRTVISINISSEHFFGMFSVANVFFSGWTLFWLLHFDLSSNLKKFFFFSPTVLKLSKE